MASRTTRHIPSLLSADAPTVTGTAALAGGGVLTVAGVPTVLATATLTGGGTLTAAGTPTVVAAVTIAGGGILTAAGTGTTVATATTGTFGGVPHQIRLVPEPAVDIEEELELLLLLVMT